MNLRTVNWEPGTGNLVISPPRDLTLTTSRSHTRRRTAEIRPGTDKTAMAAVGALERAAACRGGRYEADDCSGRRTGARIFGVRVCPGRHPTSHTQTGSPRAETGPARDPARHQAHQA